MTNKRVMFEVTDDEETVELPQAEDQEAISEQSSSANDDNAQVFEDAGSDLFEQTEEVLQSPTMTDEESSDDLLSDEDELFSDSSALTEEGDTKIFEKIDNDSDSSDLEKTLEVNEEDKKENNMKKGTAKQPKTIRRKKKERLGFNWFFWISLIIIAIPVGYFIYLLVEASKVSHVPILGDRIKNTVVYTINESDVNYISTTVKQLDGVEDAEVNLIVETLRIVVNVNDEYTEDQIKGLILNIYSIVDGKIPIATYFTRDGDYKQYDLDITVYNDINSEKLIIVSLIKNGSMEEYTIQVLSTAVNPELVDKLKEEQNPAKKEIEPDDEEDYSLEDGDDYDPEIE
ncbi:MAG: hypothetical protein ACOX1F_03715 [Erysipelotrichaceae bacterium]|jgi:copper chaperone CopZ